MYQSQYQSDRMKDAAEDLKKILEELAPYEKKVMVEEISTAGSWRSADESQSEQLIAILT